MCLTYIHKGTLLGGIRRAWRWCIFQTSGPSLTVKECSLMYVAYEINVLFYVSSLKYLLCGQTSKTLHKKGPPCDRGVPSRTLTYCIVILIWAGYRLIWAGNREFLCFLVLLGPSYCRMAYEIWWCLFYARGISNAMCNVSAILVQCCRHTKNKTKTPCRSSQHEFL